MKKWFLFPVLIFASQLHAQVLPVFGGERAGIAAMSFLKNDMSPRSLAMGGASVALDADAYSLWTNPAAIADMPSFNMATTNYSIGAGVNQSFLSVVTPRKNKVSAWGFSLNVLNSGAIKERTEFQPEGTGREVFVTNGAAGLTYAQQLSSMFRLGVTLKYIYENVAEFYNHTMTADVSFLYETDFKELQFAVMVQNFGGNSSLTGDYLAVAFNRSPLDGLDRDAVPNVFSLGVSMVPWEQDHHKIRTAIQLNHPTDNAENYRLGVEYTWRDILAVRTGYKINVRGQDWPTFGFGVRSRIGGHPLHIDYAMNPTNFMGWQHLIGLRFAINKDLFQ
jgi:hypothetical protein